MYDVPGQLELWMKGQEQLILEDGGEPPEDPYVDPPIVDGQMGG